MYLILVYLHSFLKLVIAFVSQSLVKVALPLRLLQSLMPKQYETPEERHEAHFVSKHRHYTRYINILLP